jgi:hypothetical protein
MRPVTLCATLCALTLVLFFARGQEAFRPASADLQQIQAKLAELTAATDSLRAAKVDDDLLVDVEVCRRAAQNILRFPYEFFDQKHVDNAVSALDRGLERARQVQEGKPLWPNLKGPRKPRMIAEYERAQIAERCRRGKKHMAHQGGVNVLPERLSATDTRRRATPRQHSTR